MTRSSLEPTSTSMADNIVDYPANRTAAAADASKEAPEDDHAEALKRYQRAYEHDRLNIDRAYEDLRFRSEEGQWDDVVRREREGEGRPILTVNQVPQFVRQVTGDMRQMRPGIKVVPVDERGDKNIAAKIMPGMIRYIEQRSDAQAAYFSAADSQVTAGIGHWRVLTEYADYSTFNQEIRISQVDDGVGVLWDPDALLPTREDAKFCFVPVDMSRAAFEEKYPDASADSLTQTPQFFRTWFTNDSVRVAEYWCKVPSKRTLALMPDGGIDDVTDEIPAKVRMLAQQGARIEKRDGFKVRRYVISASEVLEGPDDWPGRYIPVIPLLGEEVKIGREVVRHGVVRYLKDPQRIYNYSIST